MSHRTYEGFIVAGDVNPPIKRSFRLKLFHSVRTEVEVEVLGKGVTVLRYNYIA
jgi:hypothetical protein